MFHNGQRSCDNCDGNTLPSTEPSSHLQTAHGPQYDLCHECTVLALNALPGCTEKLLAFTNKTADEQAKSLVR